MRKGIHPENYRLVAFKDMSNEDVFLTKSTANTKEPLEVEGVEYPLVKMEISRSSHPFYTGKKKLIDTAGRIDKFKTKYGLISDLIDWIKGITSQLDWHGKNNARNSGTR